MNEKRTDFAQRDQKLGRYLELIRSSISCNTIRRESL